MTAVHTHSTELRCEECGGALAVVCVKKNCADPLEERRKSRGPVATEKPLPPPRSGTCNVAGCDAPVVAYSGMGRPPTKCDVHWNPQSKRGKG